MRSETGRILPSTSSVSTSRRRVAAAAVWSVPAVMATTAAPASAASTPPCKQSEITRPRPFRVSKPKGAEPVVPKLRPQPRGCVDSNTRPDATCRDWRAERRNRDALAQQRAEYLKQMQAYQAYKADDAAWDAENPGCKTAVPRSDKPVAPPSPKPTQPSSPQPTQPTQPVQPAPEACTPWNRWSVHYTDIIQGGIDGWAGVTVSLNVEVRENTQPVGGCAAPVENTSYVSNFEVLRAKGGQNQIRKVRQMSINAPRANYLKERLVKEPKTGETFKPGDVVWHWQFELNPAALYRQLRNHKALITLHARGGGVGDRINNQLRIDGSVVTFQNKGDTYF